MVILYEAIYYLEKPEKFFQEAHGVLRDGGVLLIATVNKDWSEFNPSPFSTCYFSVPELGRLLQDNGFNMEFYGAFSVLPKGLKENLIALIKRTTVAFHLIPKTMKGKEFLKRVLFGKLIPLPPEIKEGMADYDPPVELPVDKVNRDFKILYAVGKK